jgi:hypothetical protein
MLLVTLVVVLVAIVVIARRPRGDARQLRVLMGLIGKIRAEQTRLAIRRARVRTLSGDERLEAEADLAVIIAEHDDAIRKVTALRDSLGRRDIEIPRLDAALPELEERLLLDEARAEVERALE